MGAWGPGIFENDDALDVRHHFRKLVREKLSMEEITRRCLMDYPDPMNDISVVLALAALQMEKGCLLPDIRRQAISLIDSKADIARWIKPDERVQVLELFKQKILKT